MTDISNEARGLCARWFAGPNNVLTSDLPHETLNEVKDAMAELVAVGLVTQEPWTREMPMGRMCFRGSPEAARIGREVRQEILTPKEFRATQSQA